MENAYEICSFAKGEVIFNKGSYEPFMYNIKNGVVAIYTEYGTAAEKLLVELGADKFFGEMGAIDCLPRSATAVAVEDVTLERIDAVDLREYLHDHQDKFLEIMRFLSSRTRALTEDYREACKTAKEILDAEKNGGKKSTTLKEKILHFVRVWAEAEALAAKNGYSLGMNTGFYGDHFII